VPEDRSEIRALGMAEKSSLLRIAFAANQAGEMIESRSKMS